MTNHNKQPIQTAGGAYVANDVHTEGGDFVGRDKIINNNIYTPPAAIAHQASLYHGNFTRHPFEPESVLIPAGPFLMGSDVGTQPQHQVHLPDFRMGKSPVTNREYEYFITDNNIFIPPELCWNGQKPPQDQRERPVCGVTFHEVLAYCEWLSRESGRDYTLPTEAHWEKAIHGLCTENESHNLMDTIREWTCSLWGERLQKPDPCYADPWQDDDRNDPYANDQIRRIWRGGGSAACGNQLPTSRGFPQKRLGFRVMMKIEGE